MWNKYKMTAKEKRDIASHRGGALPPRMVKAARRELCKLHN